MGRSCSHFPGIALESTGASAFQRIRTRHAEHSYRLTRLAQQIYVHTGNFHPTSLRSHLAKGEAKGEISPNRVDSLPM